MATGPLILSDTVRTSRRIQHFDELVEIHRQPEGGAYRHVERIGRGGSVSPQAFPDVVPAVDEILGD